MSSGDAKTPAEKVRFILGQGDEDGGSESGSIHLESRQLFIQMDILAHFDDGQMGWKELARWLKFEETVETGNRWSKPHVPTPTMHGFLELRKALTATLDDKLADRCAVSLNVNVSSNSRSQVADVLMNTIRKNWDLSEEVLRKIEHVVLEPHKHLHRNAKNTKHQDTAQASLLPSSNTQTTLSSTGDEELAINMEPAEKPHKKTKRFQKREGSGKDLTQAYYSYPEGVSPDNLKPYKPNKKLTKKLPLGCESANLLVGQVDFLDETLMVLCRLENLSTMADLTEVAVPTRFIFLVLGPSATTSIWELAEVGRSMAALLNDKIFCEVAYKAKTKENLVDGLDEFLDDVLVLPPSLWDPATRLQPPSHVISMEKIRNRLEDSTRYPTGADDCGGGHEETGIDPTLQRTGRLFGGLIMDIKRRYPLYLSDIKDGLNVQCFASTIFLFFACITPIVTFGGLMGQKTDGYMGTMETLVSGFVCGVLYALFSGQPLTIVGSTGPLLVFESIVYSLCKDNEIDFMPFRFWIGFWIMLALIVIVAFDLSAYVAYITRFTEECFSILISVIFIYEAFTKVLHIWDHNAVHTGTVRENLSMTCHCEPSDSVQVVNYTDVYRSVMSNWTEYFTEDCVTLHDRVMVKHGCLSEEECENLGWNLTGPACHRVNVTHSVPDVFLLSVILFVSTFSIAYFFRNIRTSRFFPSFVRTILADFAVLISILTCTGIDLAFGIDTPKLYVPSGFKTTRSDRGWLINPFALSHWWVVPLAVMPALLATILVFLDQQISAVIVNRKEHKFKKGHGYHLDLLVLSVLVFICSLLGLPWFVAATVRSITHVKSLFVESETSLPGERPQMLGCREQRVTGVAIHVLIGLATLLTSALGNIPMPVLYGVFLYMGVTSLGGVQFFERVLILFMPAKYQPDYIYLRHVKTSRVHIFTAIQIVCMIAMWVVKSVKSTSIAFPVMLIALIAIRKLLDYTFTQSDLFWLDHLLPDAHRRDKEDKQIQEGMQQKTKTRNVPPRRELAPPSEAKDAKEVESLMSEKAMEAEGMLTNGH